ncbi:nucleoside hydrolase [Tessaracoccus lapidicaptus]|uniref:nucleoside hydrolase n=1 Tax=Tessaracoccus lapidicaptus TaxID=1427523 RepID=UPI00333EFA9C
MAPRRVILDCDPGMDDSMAIVMACKSPALEVMAITTTHGNYPVDVTSTNARKMLDLLGRTDIPVARGMARPMVHDSPTDPFSHGADGQAENFLPEPRVPLCTLHAVDLIVDTVLAHPGEVTVICTGPMTNLAMALIKDPRVGPALAGVVAISGAFGLNEHAYANATGDTPQSEWNVYVDPEAAEIVYNSGVPLVAIGLDVATYFEVDFSDDDLAQLEASPRPEASFLRQAIRYVTGRGYDPYCTIIDCMAIGYLIDPTLVDTFKGRVGIETQGRLTYGMTVLDSRHHHTWGHLPEIDIARTADYGRFLTILRDLVLA